jgi:hypothetical protein
VRAKSPDYVHPRVVVAATFEEKTYETAYNAELVASADGNRRIFSPGQVLEKVTGFDVAADPGSKHLIWRVLRVPRPRGLSLMPSHWATSRSGMPQSQELPSMPLSLILQFKRPEYLYGSRAAQWQLWRGPYYRFSRSRDQHAVLKRLEANLADSVIVRYAAPVFHTLGELEEAQMQGKVIVRSGHVAPSVLGRHQVWTYNKAGTHGRGNPAGRVRAVETFGDLFASLLGVSRGIGEVVRYDGMAEHLAVLADTCRHRNPRLRHVVSEWAESLRRAAVPLSLIPQIVDYATIQTLTAWQGAGWWIADRRDIA